MSGPRNSDGVSNPFFARVWALMSAHETEALTRLRQDNLDALSGRVLEVGAGTGTNFAHYPSTVAEVVAVEPEALLAEHVELLGAGYTLVRREYPTAIGPVDLLCRDAQGRAVAVEVKRRGEIDGVEQLTRYLDLLNRDSLLAPVAGVFAAQQIKPQARTLATDRGIRCVTLDYDKMRGMDNDEFRLF